MSYAAAPRKVTPEKVILRSLRHKKMVCVLDMSLLCFARKPVRSGPLVVFVELEFYAHCIALSGADCQCLSPVSGAECQCRSLLVPGTECQYRPLPRSGNHQGRSHAFSLLGLLLVLAQNVSAKLSHFQGSAIITSCWLWVAELFSLVLCGYL